MRFSLYRHSQTGFTLIELIVGMTVFAIGLTAILGLLSTTISNSSYSRHEIVVAGLLREQIELVKNIRDTNLKNYVEWDKIFTNGAATASWRDGIYTIENYFTSSEYSFDDGPSAIPGSLKKSPILLKDITEEFSANLTDAHRFEKSKLSLDSQGRYTHINTPTNTETVYASYIIISSLGYTGSAGVFVPVINKDGKKQGYIIDAHVIIKNGNNYREYDAKTAITDWVK